MFRYGEPMMPGGLLGLLGPQPSKVLNGQGGRGLLGPGNLAPSYAPITDTEAFRDARLHLSAQTRPPKRRSSPKDLKRAERLGAELGRKYRHPLALASAHDLRVFEATPACLAKIATADPGKEIVGLAFLALGEVCFSSAPPHRERLEVIAHEVAHFLEPSGDEGWCSAFASAFVLACAGQCRMGNLDALRIERGETAGEGTWQVTGAIPEPSRRRAA